MLTAQGSLTWIQVHNTRGDVRYAVSRIYPNLFLLRHRLSLADTEGGTETPPSATLRKSHRPLSETSGLGPSSTSTVALAEFWRIN